MEKDTSTLIASPLQILLASVLGMISILASIFGLYWLSKIVPGIYQTLMETGFHFMTNSILFHFIWVVFFISLLVTGIKLLISASNKRAKDMVSGVTLYFLGASLVIIGLFYLLFQQYTYAVIALIMGVACIYLEGATEIA